MNSLVPMSIEQYTARFAEEPGFLNFAGVGPIGRAVVEEEAAQLDQLNRSRFGSFDNFTAQDARVRDAVAVLTGFDREHVVFQPNTSTGLLHAMFGITGGVALSAGEFPSVTFAAVRSNEALGVLTPHWIETDRGRVTPAQLRDALDPSVVAVAVSLVDFRTGYLADLDGIRQVIGDRLLIVDATQGFGVVDAPYEVADVVAAGGQKWPRAGWGTGFLALSDRALEHLTPVMSGFVGTDVEGIPMDAVAAPTRRAAKFQISHPDPMAEARFAAALEEIAAVGVPAINARIAERVSRIIDLADEYALPVTSPRAEHERAGIVVVEPEPDQLTVLAASLHNHGISATLRSGHVRFAPHASTTEESLAMLKAAFLSFSTAIS